MLGRMKKSQDHEKSGRALIASGNLVNLRNRLGLSRSAMTELLQLSVATYARYETEPESGWRMRPWTAERVGRFAYLAEITLAELAEDNITVDDLTPLHIAAVMHGIPQEVLFHWYRSGVIQAEDLGILGLWIHKEDLHLVEEALC